MSFWKIFSSVLGMVAVFSFVIYWMSEAVLQPTDRGITAEWDMTVARAPSDAKKIKNPIEPSPEVIEQGKRLYLGKGDCYLCHGLTGRGDGEAGRLLNPPPRDFTSERFHLLRTDGELFWVIVNGSQGTGMFSYTPRMISEEEAWMVVRYMRTLAEQEGS